MLTLANIFDIRRNLEKGAVYFVIALSLFLSIVAIIIASVHRPSGAADPSGGTHRPSGSRTEAFTPVGGMDYPKLGDAFKNSWYDTFGRECKHHKCKVWNGHNYQYFCSENKNCRVPEQNLQGKRMKNMSWFERYV